MIDPVIGSGQDPTYPLKPCGCKQVGCDLASDSNDRLIYDGSVIAGYPLTWIEILNEPGWKNGYPPWFGGQGVGLTASRIIDDTLIVRETCDCGMAASDYSVSRDGGPGHSDWCKVADR